ncbi:MAG: glycosyltransferase family 2 protein [Desulfosoma sp.]|uniref:glycosyltransferase family 2 protein n=1 Tax=Desulfosoma sp. TaxID=2603217 RepID=UPI00404A9455
MDEKFYKYRVSIIIPVYNGIALTSQCLVSLVQTIEEVPCEIIVVDNNSSDGTQVFLASFREKHPELNLSWIRNEENLGFAKGCNQGARSASGRCLIFLNNDVIALQGWLKPLLRALETNTKVGVVGAKLIYPDGTIQHAGVVVGDAPAPVSPFHKWCGKPRDYPEANRQRACQAVTGACFGIRKNLFEELGGFDEGYMNGYEDVDLCFRARERGYEVLYIPSSELIHLESKTEGRFLHEEANVIRLNAKWHNRIQIEENVTHWPNVSIIVVDHKGSRDTVQCLASILAFDVDWFHGVGLLYKQFNVIVVENDDDRSHGGFIRQWCQAHGIDIIVQPDEPNVKGPNSFFDRRVILLRAGRNLGFAGGCNLGVRQALQMGAQFTWLLNNDTLVHPHSLALLVSAASMAKAKGLRIGLVGSMLRKWPDTELVQFDGMRVDYGGRALSQCAHQQLRFVPYVSGASMLVCRAFWEKTGPMNEDFFLYYEDNELCARCLDLGWHIVYQPRSIVYHKGGTSIGHWLASPLSIYYAVRNFLLFHETKNTLEDRVWGVLATHFWPHIGEGRDNIQAFCDGIYDFLLGRKGPRHGGNHARESSSFDADLLKGCQRLQRLGQRLQESPDAVTFLDSFLRLAFSLYQARDLARKKYRRQAAEPCEARCQNAPL